MKILLLGYGKEGQAAEKYLRAHFPGAEIEIWQDFKTQDLLQRDYSPYDIIFRSPSVPPLGLPQETSVTRYFFEHAPCQIIGVTATKGKGTTCSSIKALLDEHGYDAHLVGNIGAPAIEALDELTPESVVVYEMSSFQLWDLPASPHIAVVGMIEPDHLNVHADFNDYVSAKANIARHQTENDYLVYYSMNNDSCQIAAQSEARQIAYPFAVPEEVRLALALPGEHNLNNAMAAIAAVACLKNISPDEYLSENLATICAGLNKFHGLPHRLEFLRELNNVKYYDDNFSTNIGSTRVAVQAFPEENVVAIVGGRDKTDYADLLEIVEVLSAPQVKKVILMGESGREIAKKYADVRFIEADSLAEAVKKARTEAEKFDKAVVLMSPSAASFDMFKNVYDRGAQFQKLVKNLE